MELKDRTAIVTGASSGIGREIAIAFAAEGANVVLASPTETSKRDKHTQTTTEIIQENGGTVIYQETDVTVEDDVKELANVSIEEYGSIDILVNNAGVLSENPIHKTTEEQWDTIHDVNLKGIYWCSKYTIPSLIKSSYGRIINMSSQRGLIGGAEAKTAAYDSSKGAVTNLTRQMAIDYGPKGIAVNAICPGPIKSKMTPIETEESREQYLEDVLTPFIGDPEDIASAAVFLASDSGRYIHGHNFVIDGGYLVKP